MAGGRCVSAGSACNMSSGTKPKVCGTGLVALDLVVSSRPDAPILGSTGGTCGNVLCILAWLGWDAYPVARMNSGAASEYVRKDMGRWGVHLDWASCAPTTHAPMVVHEIILTEESQPKHRFSWSCPQCGSRLPSYRPITVPSAHEVRPKVADASVFFFDRPSRGALALASDASCRGAVVVFEPSGRADGRLMAEAISLAHIVKYSHQRSVDVCGLVDGGSTPLLEVQTLGDRGLRYRHRFGHGGRLSGWKEQKPFCVSHLADACGAGDWCTAGLIASTSGGGQSGLSRIGASGVGAGLLYGQALAAWNCSFEGARGGMYVADRSEFESQINRLINGGCLGGVESHQGASESRQAVMCPSCSTYR